MKHLTLITILLLSAAALKTQAQQKYQYSYDANGNRVTRTLVPMFKSTKSNSNTEAVSYEEKMADMKVTIYPNPTQGELKVDVANMPTNAKGYIVITDMQGRLLYQTTNITSSNNINLSSQTAGNYIMRVVVDDKNKEWMIVKQ